MKKIFVRKIFPYDPTFAGKYTKYQGYSLITLKKEDPGVRESKLLVLPEPPAIIFTSSLRRGIGTGRLIGKQYGTKEQRSLSELNEVLFDLRFLLTEEEYNLMGSDLVRKRFIEAFIADKLAESRNHIKTRMNKVLDLVESLTTESYLFISHSFFMKLLQIYMEDSRLFEKPGILMDKFDPTKKTFEFGKGFEFNL